MNDTKQWYEESYKNSGFSAQRRYPNEELLRFFGSNFFDKEVGNRGDIKVLEVGSGSCANLWMIAREGFDAYGVDLSKESLILGERVLSSWNVEAQLTQGSFLNLPYKDSSFDIVVDVFSMNCVNHEDFLRGLREVYRVLKRGGIFFSYTPSKNSDTFKSYKPAIKVDDWTLNGIYKETSPYYGNYYPFHFFEKEEYKKILVKKRFKIKYLETIQRSYRQTQEKFEHIVVFAEK